MRDKKEFLGYLHSFRGFAILNIVFIHAVVGALIAESNELDMTNPMALINEVLFHDSTLYFAVISGILFSAILKKKGYIRFYTNKLKFVVLPYLFLTAIVVIFKALAAQEESTDPFLVSYLSILVKDFAYGKANPLFWYIPVLIFLYIVTPLVDYLMNLKRVGGILILLLIIAPMVVSRVQMAFEYILSIKTMIYFTGAYAAGMYLGSDLENKLSWIKAHMNTLIILSTLSTIGLFILYIQEIDMVSSISTRESLFYVQKMCLSGVFILVFKNLEERQPRWLHILARDSFAIYFLHGFAIFGSLPLFMFLLSFDTIAPFNTIIGSLVLVAFSIGLSMLIILGFRKLLGQNSRMLIGS